MGSDGVADLGEDGGQGGGQGLLDAVVAGELVQVPGRAVDLDGRWARISFRENRAARAAPDRRAAQTHPGHASAFIRRIPVAGGAPVPPRRIASQVQRALPAPRTGPALLQLTGKRLKNGDLVPQPQHILQGPHASSPHQRDDCPSSMRPATPPVDPTTATTREPTDQGPAIASGPVLPGSPRAAGTTAKTPAPPAKTPAPPAPRRSVQGRYSTRPPTDETDGLRRSTRHHLGLALPIHLPAPSPWRWVLDGGVVGGRSLRCTFPVRPPGGGRRASVGVGGGRVRGGCRAGERCGGGVGWSAVFGACRCRLPCRPRPGHARPGEGPARRGRTR